MAADPIIYCLEELTDYREFEKLCCALLACMTSYPLIDPMGGVGDKGRDAIVREDGSGKTIAFAFTVRKDWFDKLKSDSKRLSETQSKLDKLVFICTVQLSASDKDKAYWYIQETYGWPLDLFDLARLRALLVQPGCNLITSHPSIFTPNFFLQVHTPHRNFAQHYLDQYARLFQELASSTENLAVEIDREMYGWIDWVVKNAKAVELTCYDLVTLNILIKLHAAITKIFNVISDSYYITSSYDSLRVKFDNTERIGVNVQVILSNKKEEILLCIEEFRAALNEFSVNSKNNINN